MNSSTTKLTKKPAATQRSSTSFKIADDFNSVLHRSVIDHVTKVTEDRKRQFKLETIISTAIKMILDVQPDLKPHEIAMAVTQILHDLVREGAIEGRLPSDERIKSAVRNKLHPKPVKAAQLPSAEPGTAGPQTTTSAVQHGFQAAAEERLHSAGGEIPGLL